VPNRFQFVAQGQVSQLHLTARPETQSTPTEGLFQSTQRPLPGPEAITQSRRQGPLQTPGFKHETDSNQTQDRSLQDA
jgi:hypothetical protein